MPATPMAVPTMPIRQAPAHRVGHTTASRGPAAARAGPQGRAEASGSRGSSTADVGAGCVRAVDAGVGADEAVVGLAIRSAPRRRTIRRALAQHQLGCRASPPSPASSARQAGRLDVARSTTRPSALLTALWDTTTTSPSSAAGPRPRAAGGEVGARRRSRPRTGNGRMLDCSARGPAASERRCGQPRGGPRGRASPRRRRSGRRPARPDRRRQLRVAAVEHQRAGQRRVQPGHAGRRSASWPSERSIAAAGPRSAAPATIGLTATVGPLASRQWPPGCRARPGSGRSRSAGSTARISTAVGAGEASSTPGAGRGRLGAVEAQPEHRVAVAAADVVGLEVELALGRLEHRPQPVVGHRQQPGAEAQLLGERGRGGAQRLARGRSRSVRAMCSPMSRSPSQNQASAPRLRAAPAPGRCRRARPSRARRRSSRSGCRARCRGRARRAVRPARGRRRRCRRW